ncbi:MAG: hypothetical protein IJJ41_00550 [Clostridia bacterium]|nr:hypothetical protein [Clostridia bacterium]
MNKRIVAICLCFIIACGIFAGCKKKEGAAKSVAVIVTDKNGAAVTNENGEVVTEIGVPVTDEDGKNVTEKATNAAGEVITDSEGNPKTVVVTEAGSSKTTTATAAKTDKATKKGDKTTKKSSGDNSGEVPYSTTTPENNKTLDQWTFGDLTKVGCIAPNGWSNEAVNQVVKNGTDIRAIMCPVNYLKEAGYKNADDYLKFYEEMAEKENSKPKRISYSKDVYSDGVGIELLEKVNKAEKDENGYVFGKYHMTYIFQTGDRVRVYFVYGSSEEEAKTSIADVIANTYYRG